MDYGLWTMDYGLWTILIVIDYYFAGIGLTCSSKWYRQNGKYFKSFQKNLTLDPRNYGSQKNLRTH